jgi:ABC-2 type transport system ATP-binding protein
MLEVNQLSRKYDSFLAVDNVSFTIGKGEIVGLLGHNGAGKTTIMKMISGYLEANTGSVQVDGIDLQSDPKEVQNHLGYLPENLPVYPEMTVADYLDFAADLKGLKDNAKTSEIQRVITATDISVKLLAPIATLSRGFKQRVGVAQAILGRPKLLILDEPTNGLDPEQTQHMRDLIKDVAKDATVILSTHIMQEVEALCSRVLMLHGGRLALDEELETIRQSNHLLLETSLNKEEVEAISKISGVEHIETLTIGGEVNKYRIRFSADVSPKELSALVAQAVADKKSSLYLLHPELRDLETLFKEVNEGKFDDEGVQNAA